MLEVIAGVVFKRLAHARYHCSIGQHHLQPQHRLTRHAIAQHPIAARIVGNDAADLAATPAADVHREEQPLGLNRLLQGLQANAGLHRDCARHGVDFLDVTQSLQRQHHLASLRHAGTRQTGHAALQHHGLAQGVQRGQQTRHLVGIAGPQNRQRLATCTAPIGTVALVGIRARDKPGRVQQGLANRAQAVQGHRITCSQRHAEGTR